MKKSDFNLREAENLIHHVAFLQPQIRLYVEPTKMIDTKLLPVNRILVERTEVTLEEIGREL